MCIRDRPKTGQKIWSLKFSLYDDNKLFESNASFSRYIEGGYSRITDNEIYDTDNFQDNGEGGKEFKATSSYDANSFITNVLNWVCMGDKFIFQPNNEVHGGDAYYLCRLETNEIRIKRKYDRLYEFSLKIIEVINWVTIEQGSQDFI